MTELHPSISAVGSHLDEQIEIALLAHRYYEEEGRPEGHAAEHWLRAERELRRRADLELPATPPTEADIQTEEAMHLDR